MIRSMWCSLWVYWLRWLVWKIRWFLMVMLIMCDDIMLWLCVLDVFFIVIVFWCVRVCWKKLIFLSNWVFFFEVFDSSVLIWGFVGVVFFFFLDLWVFFFRIFYVWLFLRFFDDGGVGGYVGYWYWCVGYCDVVIVCVV